MPSWIIVSRERGMSILHHGTLPLLGAAFGRRAGAAGVRPDDAKLVPDKQGNAALALSAEDENDWIALYDSIGDKRRGSSLEAFVSVASGDLERWFPDAKTEIHFRRNQLRLKVTRPDPSLEATYNRYGPFRRRFLRFEHLLGQASVSKHNVYLSNDPDTPDLSSPTNLFWNPIRIDREDAFWDDYLDERNFLGRDTVALLPPWMTRSDEGFFAWKAKCRRNVIRTRVGAGEPSVDEPLALVLWRLMDDDAITDVLARGGDLWIAGLPGGNPPATLGGTRPAVRLPVDGGPTVDYTRHFFSRPSSFSDIGRRVSQACAEDLNHMVGAPAKQPTPIVDENREWPFADSLGAADGEWRSDEPFRLLLAFLGGEEGGQAAAEALGIPPDNYALAMNDFVRRLWQPGGRQMSPEEHIDYWRHDVLVDGGLLTSELMGRRRDVADRLLPRLAYRVEPTNDVWTAWLSDKCDDEDIVRVALLLPVGARVVLGTCELVLDDPVARLDEAVLG